MKKKLGFIFWGKVSILIAIFVGIVCYETQEHFYKEEYDDLEEKVYILAGIGMLPSSRYFPRRRYPEDYARILGTPSFKEYYSEYDEDISPPQYPDLSLEYVDAHYAYNKAIYASIARNFIYYKKRQIIKDKIKQLVETFEGSSSFKILKEFDKYYSIKVDIKIDIEGEYEKVKELLISIDHLYRLMNWQKVNIKYLSDYDNHVEAEIELRLYFSRNEIKPPKSHLELDDGLFRCFVPYSMVWLPSLKQEIDEIADSYLELCNMQSQNPEIARKLIRNHQAYPAQAIENFTYLFDDIRGHLEPLEFETKKSISDHE